jgi:hypothetical protein
LPVTLKANLLYDEKITEVGVGTGYGQSSVRHYASAQAHIAYSEGSVEPKLREDRSIVAVATTVKDRKNQPRPIVFSPLGPLTRDELELIDVPACSLLIDALLPNRGIAVGSSWQLTCPQLAVLLGLDHVKKSDLTCTLDRVEDNSAVVHIKGDVSGTAGGVDSKIRLAAKYSFDTQRKRIGWFAMSLNEQRSSGYSHPGSKVTARVQMATAPLAGIPELDDKVLADLALEPSNALQLLEFISLEGGFQLLSERNWQLITDRKDVTVLRLVEHGDLVAQCNFSSLPDLPENKDFGMREFQADVKRALEENMANFVGASESTIDGKIRALRVVAAGEASDVPIQWIYYHLMDQQGRRASCVFTLEADLAERFAAADQPLISSFRFLDDDADGDRATAAINPPRPRR